MSSLAYPVERASHTHAHTHTHSQHTITHAHTHTHTITHAHEQEKVLQVKKIPFAAAFWGGSVAAPFIDDIRKRKREKIKK